MTATTTYVLYASSKPWPLGRGYHQATLPAPRRAAAAAVGAAACATAALQTATAATAYCQAAAPTCASAMPEKGGKRHKIVAYADHKP